MNWGVWGVNHSKQDMCKLISESFDSGINSFDHADIYGGYTTEEYFGDAFAEAALTATTFEQAAKRAINSVAATILSKAATFAMLRMFFPTALGVGVEGKTALGFGDFLAGALGIKHEGGEVQKFASGGVVRGRDNVPILAQAGEFIIRRESAQSIGLNNLRQMNETGQPASVVVNIHGGVVQDDYVRNELIPALNTALTSGARINA